jgi:predicted small lipoprotein YifL
MKTITRPIAIALLLSTAAACGDDGNTNVDPDAPVAPDAPPGTPAVTFRQVEHLARPGINEALLFTDGFNEGYNATAPSFAGVPEAVLGMVVGEAKTVLKAIYLGACLVNGALGLTPGAGGNGVKPAGVPCGDTTNLFSDGNLLAGTTISQAAADGADDYADKVFAQFVPDVMRIDTTNASDYFTLCNGAASVGAELPLLCGGRRLNDDVIDVTYNYLIVGAIATPGPINDGLAGQVRALASDGVVYDNTETTAGAGLNANSLTVGVPANSQQGHPAITNTFPYSAPPI